MLLLTHTNKYSFIAPPSIALKTRELDDATVNNHTPSCLSVLSHTLQCFSVGQPFSKQLYSEGLIIAVFLCLSNLRRLYQSEGLILTYFGNFSVLLYHSKVHLEVYKSMSSSSEVELELESKLDASGFHSIVYLRFISL